jgi:GT2 family glycosyltransferase
MDVSIVIVNWNSTEFLVACVESVERTTRGIKYEIIVVDNASDDESWRILTEKFPSIRVIRSDRNLGFARANNLASEYAHGDKILFLNPDTLIVNDCISIMAKLLDADSRIGVLGCRLLNPDLGLQTSCVQPFPTILNQLLTVDWLKYRWPSLPLWGMRPLFSFNPSGVNEADVVSGACLMMNRDVFEKVGGFSTEYFMYAEEMDLCRKVTEAGWKICHAGGASVIHFGGQSTRKRGDAFSHVLMRDSVFKLLQKFRGNRYAQIYRASLFVSAVFRLAVLLPLRIIPGRLLDRDRIVYALRKWRRIASWSLALESWTQELGTAPSYTMVVKN